MSFDSGFERWRASSAHASLMGKGYPEAMEPFSFVPFPALTELAGALRAEPGGMLVDLDAVDIPSVRRELCPATPHC